MLVGDDHRHQHRLLAAAVHPARPPATSARVNACRGSNTRVDRNSVLNLSSSTGVNIRGVLVAGERITRIGARVRIRPDSIDISSPYVSSRTRWPAYQVVSLELQTKCQSCCTAKRYNRAVCSACSPDLLDDVSLAVVSLQLLDGNVLPCNGKCIFPNGEPFTLWLSLVHLPHM